MPGQNARLASHHDITIPNSVTAVMTISDQTQSHRTSVGPSRHSRVRQRHRTSKPSGRGRLRVILVPLAAVGLTRSLFLKELYVIESARRTGAGTAIMGSLAEVALKNDCSRFEWQTDSPNTEAALLRKARHRR